MNTLLSSGFLNQPIGLLAALLIGLGFGVALEKAGFGSSRKLAGVFYLKDMTVIKVMFTAVVTAMTGLFLLAGLGAVPWEHIYLLPTRFGPQIIGGLLFGIGFAMSAWCPGTAGVGAASGRADALVFLGAAGLGSILYNELFPLFGGLTAATGSVRFVFSDLGLSMSVFAGLFILVAIGAFWGSEWVERKHGGEGRYWNTRFLKGFSLVLLLCAAALFAVPGPDLGEAAEEAAVAAATAAPAVDEATLLTQMGAGEDHLEPEALADRLLTGTAPLLVDLRWPDEYAAFHLPGAINVQPADLPVALAAHRDREILLYSNGMTHPAQARDALARLGFTDVKILTDGIIGFRERVLTPVSLRDRPLSAGEVAKVNAWRTFFAGGDDGVAGSGSAPVRLVDAAWLKARLHDVKVLELRSQKKYSGGHIPGSLRFHEEHLRTTVEGIGSRLQPPALLAAHLGLMGIAPDDTVALVADRVRDATLVALALDVLGHERWVVVDGGFGAWQAAGFDLATALPTVTPADYPAPATAPRWAVDADAVLAASRAGTTIIDTRPAKNYTGEKRDEARGGHVPGAVNRPYEADLVLDAEGGQTDRLKPVAELRAAYTALAPDPAAPVILHCRTGHQASQGWFVLRHVLGYRDVRWYDAGWTEWAQRPELPVKEGAEP